jgi:hypothetical protein
LPIACPPPWLEVIEGESPLLLIAPHGGRAKAARDPIASRKVNDLYTAEITRALASRLGARALVNSGMDRNRLDLNRLSQISAGAPWLLDAIAESVARIIARHGRVTVLIIHGWNVIEPRLDFGLGLRRHGEELRPSGTARVSASDDFIHGPVAQLAERLRRDGITASFGLRYPAAGAQNLLQAFTDRHASSAVEALRMLSASAARGEIDALQLELSVAIRIPGRLRARCMEAIGAVFAPVARATDRPKFNVVRRSAERPATRSTSARVAPSPPGRIGIELVDPVARVGLMASFDLGHAAAGARIMLLMPEGRVALFTAEGKPRREANRVSLGALALEADASGLRLTFGGPAVVVPDASAYLSIERALASGWLDETMDVSVGIEPWSRAFDPAEMFRVGDAPADGTSRAGGFGRASGKVRVDGIAVELAGFARSGLSASALGAAKFDSRRMIWACFDSDGARAGVELRAVAAGGENNRSARMLCADRWEECVLERLEVDTPSPIAPPVKLGAELRACGPRRLALAGTVLSFIPLSRPGPGKSRILTTLGFARFQIGAHEGAGMFEHSRHHSGRREVHSDEDEAPG